MLDFSQVQVSPKVLEIIKQMDVDQEYIDEFVANNKKFLRYIGPHVDKYMRKNKDTSNILKDLRNIINRFDENE